MRPRLAYLGLAFVHCWLWGIQRVVAASAAAAFQPVLFLGLNAACLLLGLAAVARKGNVSTLRAVPVAFAVVGVLATAGLFAVGSLGGGVGVELACAAACGASIGGFYLVWTAFYARLDIR